MSKVLVSLVSDQTIPNILLIRELGDINKYIFITTEKMEKNHVTDSIISASGIAKGVYSKINVLEDSSSDIEHKLRQIEFDDDDEFFVNLTCGTKIMSIAVYNFFVIKSCEIYYISIGKNSYQKLFPEKKKRDFDIQYRLGVREYLTSYGISIENPNKTNILVKTEQETDQFFECYLKLSYESHGLLNQLRPYRNKKQIAITEIDGLQQFLDEIHFKSNKPDILNRDEIQYLTGSWFEEYIYNRIKDCLGLNTDHIALNINIQRRKVKNELDVVFTIGNELHVVECKTSIFNSENDHNITNESIYKLAALKKDFGLTVKSYIFTLSPRGEEKQFVRQTDINRSQLFNIQIIDRQMIQNELQSILLKLKK
ncbi:MAG: DUF1887 family protein [Desulfobacterales bacterium]|nr:DUF1887 family protein [Desulfobacterales bacterium]